MLPLQAKAFAPTLGFVSSNVDHAVLTAKRTSGNYFETQFELLDSKDRALYKNAPLAWKNPIMGKLLGYHTGYHDYYDHGPLSYTEGLGKNSFLIDLGDNLAGSSRVALLIANNALDPGKNALKEMASFGNQLKISFLSNLGVFNSKVLGGTGYMPTRKNLDKVISTYLEAYEAHPKLAKEIFQVGQNFLRNFKSNKVPSLTEMSSGATRLVLETNDRALAIMHEENPKVPETYSAYVTAVEAAKA